MLKKVLGRILLVVVAVAIAAAAFALFEATAFDASVNKVYAIAAPDIRAAGDPAVIARGKHLAESIGGCLECHGADLGGKAGDDMGPIGSIAAPNLTRGRGGVIGAYSDGQLARVIRHGIKASGKSLRFMPAQDISWWPDDDLTALVSYLRTLAPVDRDLGPPRIGLLGKVLDRVNMLPLDIARRIDHDATPAKTLPAVATAEYGAKLAISCKGCHGDHYSGGAIPGAPSNLPIPSNITPHESGIAAMTEAQWNRLLDQGIKRSGQPLDPFMPIQMLRAMDATERRAVWMFLRSLPARKFGER